MVMSNRHANVLHVLSQSGGLCKSISYNKSTQSYIRHVLRPILSLLTPNLSIKRNSGFSGLKRNYITCHSMVGFIRKVVMIRVLWAFHHLGLRCRSRDKTDVFNQIATELPCLLSANIDRILCRFSNCPFWRGWGWNQRANQRPWHSPPRLADQNDAREILCFIKKITYL